ncbi:MAG: alpha/beta fold hydrolase [Pseudomonadota bacterium]
MLTKLKSGAEGAGRAVLFMPTHAGNFFPYLRIVSKIEGADVYGVENLYGDDTIAGQGRALAGALGERFCRSTEITCVGWSFGGAIAHEVAAALVSSAYIGAEAVLIDAPVAGPANLAEPFLAIDDRFCEFFVDKPGFEMRAYPSLRALKDALAAVDSRISEEMIDGLYLRYALNQARWLRHTPSPSSARVLQLRARASTWGDVNFAAWKDAAARYAVTPIPGDHYSVVGDAGAAEIAAILSGEEVKAAV